MDKKNFVWIISAIVAVAKQSRNANNFFQQHQFFFADCALVLYHFRLTPRKTKKNVALPQLHWRQNYLFHLSISSLSFLQIVPPRKTTAAAANPQTSSTRSKKPKKTRHRRWWRNLPRPPHHPNSPVNTLQHRFCNLRQSSKSTRRRWTAPTRMRRKRRRRRKKNKWTIAVTEGCGRTTWERPPAEQWPGWDRVGSWAVPRGSSTRRWGRRTALICRSVAWIVDRLHAFAFSTGEMFPAKCFKRVGTRGRSLKRVESCNFWVFFLCLIWFFFLVSAMQNYTQQQQHCHHQHRKQITIN